MLFKGLAALHERHETPHRAILLLATISITYIFLGSAEMLMQYMGFALSVFPLVAVVGLIYLRARRPEIARPWKVPLYPLFPILFIALTLLMMFARLMAWTSTSLFALLVLAASVPVYFVWRAFITKRG
jgi:APA family basic amino acid/polyamine antiporter